MMDTTITATAVHGVAWTRGFDPHGGCLRICTA